MKTKNEVLKKARELCSENSSECAVFVSGFIRGYEECLEDAEKEKKEKEE